MNRTLKLSMLLALTLGSTQALALGLGQIRVKSALDKPLVAEIPLITDYPGEADNIQVALASAQDFTRAGLDRSAFPAQLQFTVVTDASGQKLIRVTTAEPVRETYLDFLLQVEWPRGKLLREFTVLLDPPHMLSSQGASATTGRARASTPEPTTAGKPSSAAAAASMASGSDRISGGKYGPVRSGDTLSRIAEGALPQGVNLNQMMVAMYEANRGAFVRDNMNLLKRGAVLRIPSREQAQAKSAAAAAAEVHQQYENWKGMAAQAPTMVSNTGGSAGGSASGASAPSGDRLKLVPPKQGAGGVGQAGVSGGTGDASVTGMRQELARTKETLDNLQAESKDLKSRLESLQKIHDKNQQLLSLKNAEIAELQQKLADARKAAAAAAEARKGAATQEPAAPAPAKTAPSTPAAVAMKAAVPATASTVTTTTPASAGSAAMASAPAAASTAIKASQPALAKPVAPEPKPVAPKRTPVHPAPPAEPWYMQTWAWIAGGAVAVFLLVMGLVRLRSGGKSTTPRPSLADQFSDVPFGESGVEDMDEEQHELLAELAEHPDEIGLHLELVSLYYARRDVDHFEAAAEAMYAHVSDPEQPEWQEVRAMGEELVPEHPLFAAHAPAKAEAAVDVLPEIGAEETSNPEDEHAFDVDSLIAGHDAELAETGFAVNDLGFEPEEVEEESKSAPESGGYSFDFDLTPRGTSAVAEDDFDMLPPLPEAEPHLDEVGVGGAAVSAEGTLLPDDPIDTKLDLARAYLDMGDPSGARAMLEEVLAEGTQLQRDVAQKLLDDIG